MVIMHFADLPGQNFPPNCPGQQDKLQPLKRGQGSGTVLANVYTSVVDWNDARVTRNALSALTDRELEDIGLVRGDIDQVAQSHRLF